jgi:putative ABC transport system ATP-binding protein
VNPELRTAGIAAASGKGLQHPRGYSFMSGSMDSPEPRRLIDPPRFDQSTASVGKAVLHVHDIAKVYRLGEVEVHALRKVALDLFAGEFVVLLGASGSGKSTLLNILGGLDTPTSGEVRYRDHVLTQASDRELTRYRREHVGFVFQFFNLLPSLTALENVDLVTEIAENPISAREALDRVGLADRLNHFPAQLSGGEQQRVAIARALAKRPDILLCDEPTGSLDYTTGKKVLQVLEQANRELGTLTVVITHNAAIAGMADRVIRISSGEILEVRANTQRISPAELSW